MKKYKILILLLIAILLVSCKKNNSEIEEISNINIPEDNFDLTGIWEKTSEYDIAENKFLEYEEDTMFISDKVIDFEDELFLDPNINSRYVDYNSFIRLKLTNIPATVNLDGEKVAVYNFSNNLSTNQDFVMLPDGRLMTVYINNVLFYTFKKKVDEDEIIAKYDEIKKLTEGNSKGQKRNFGLAISFRERDNTISNYSKYNYFTYYIKMDTEDEYPKVIKTKDIYVPKNTGLWEIKSETIETESNINNYKLSANPAFVEQTEKNNNIQDTLFRRIDYVNNDYISVTNLNYESNFIEESYSIYNMHEIVNKKPISVTDIAGNDGLEIFNNTFKENANLIFRAQDTNLILLNPNPTNIGIERQRMGWKFISGIDQPSPGGKNGRLYRKYDLNITTVINTVQNDNTTLTWKDITNRKFNAIDATVSPSNDFVLIQDSNSMRLYPVYFNFISNEPLFTIQNISNYEIIMTQWINEENINSFYNEFLRLPKLNNQIIY